MAQPVSCQLLTTDVWLCTQRICAGHSGNGTGFSQRVLWLFPVNIIPPLFHIQLCTTWRPNTWHVSAVPERHSLLSSQQQCPQIHNTFVHKVKKILYYYISQQLTLISYDLSIFLNWSSKFIWTECLENLTVSETLMLQKANKIPISN